MGFGYSTSAPGTPCVFGSDPRDEGSHCIMEHQYGSFGWCFTSQDKSSWGSCGETCPLSGPAKVLAGKIDLLEALIADALASTKGDIEGVAKRAAEEAVKEFAKSQAGSSAETFAGPG